MAQICIIPAPKNTNLCANGGQACVFQNQYQVMIVDPTCGPSSFTISTDSSAAISSERIQDMSIVFGLALVALAGVWGSKQLINLFSRDLER